MKVANPIYDVVFKYLMEDNKIAKLLISGLLQQDVLELELKPQEYSANLSKKTLTVYRIDFKARIKLENGDEKVVLIELQKAKLPTDIMRFRKYLGEQYANDNNIKKTEDESEALPIITIYFLGYPLDNAKDIPIIRIKRQYLEHSTNKILEIKEHFIESLTHDSIIVQIRAIEKKKRRNELEKALSVFSSEKTHEVSIDEEAYPEKYRPVIRQLIKALVNDDVRKTMDIEDEILEVLLNKERLLAQREKQLREKQEEITQKDEALEQNKKALKQKDQALEQKEQALEQKNQALEQKNQALISSVKIMKALGATTEQIQLATGLSDEKINNIKP